jgi:proline iminopeptidase
MPTFLSYDGTLLHFDVFGDEGLPVLVVQAGGPARHPDYLGDLAGLSSRRRLVVLHQRGVGESDPSPTAEAATWPKLAEDVEALRIALGLDTIELLGHSAGTRIALSYASRYPHRLASLCLVTPPAQWLVNVPDDSTAIVDRHRDAPWFSDYVTHLSAATSASTAAERNALFPFIAPIAWSTWTERSHNHERVGQWYPDAQQLFFAGTDAETQRVVAGLSAVECPVRVVAGVDDGLTGYAPVLAVARLFGRGSSMSIARAGHYPWVEQPVAFAAALADFYR